jgi:hypothetical protein
MKTRSYISTLINLGTILFLTIPAGAQNTVPPPRNFAPAKADDEHARSYERVIVRKFDVRSNPNVRIDGSFGPMTVTGATSNTVEVTIKIRVEEGSREEAKARAEKVTVRIDGTRDEVRVQTELPKGESREYTNVSIALLVPKPTALTMHNKFGSMEIRSISGEVNASGEFGAVNILNSSNVNVRNSFGDITLSNIIGSCTVEGKNGKIRAFKIAGGRIINKFGAIDINEVQGKLDVQSKMGSVSAKRIQSAVIKNEYGSILVVPSPSFSGSVKAKTSYGSISSEFPLETNKAMFSEEANGKIGNGNGELRLTNAFGEIKLKKN